MTLFTMRMIARAGGYDLEVLNDKTQIGGILFFLKKREQGSYHTIMNGSTWLCTERAESTFQAISAPG
jgi:hypothetical protein